MRRSYASRQQPDFNRLSSGQVTGIEQVRYLSEAACLAEVARASTAVISITEANRLASLQEGWGAVLQVQFADAEFDEPLLQRLAARRVSIDLYAKGFPCRERCEPILRFLETLPAAYPGITTLIVHCHAGQRRSAAVAKFAAEHFGVTFDHGYDGFNKTVYSLLQAPDRFDHLVPRKTSRGLLAGLFRTFGLSS